MPAAKLKPASARRHLQRFQFADLFVEDLGWNHPDSTKPVPLEHDGTAYRAKEISQLSGFRVFEVTPADADSPFPDAKAQNALWKLLVRQSVENIVIFLDAARKRSVWLWMKRDGKKTHPRRHHYLDGQPGDLFLSKLASLVVDLSELDEDGNIPITETARRVRDGLDIETVTKAFFKDFQEEHGKLLEAIGGIPDPRERRWYASVLLNRLMFIWFLQKKGFLDVGRAKVGNLDYLPDKLAESQQGGKDRFFRHFLRDLFFEGFAKPEEKREPLGKVPLGDIPYLNGGLFLPHGIEARIEGDALHSKAYATISVPDAVFADLFALFSRYSWSLNDTPGGDDREINPDVLGYIFEKYINQKEFGAYYTRPEITDYLCEQTIHQLVLDRVNAGHAAAKKLHETNPKTFPAPRRYADMEDLLLHADGPVCQRVIQDILPRLSLLDPACGSGAFLVAALKTLLNLYTAINGRCEALGHKPVLQWVETEKKKHPQNPPVAYWLKKKIVTENLFGVDLMEEATEIAKLRLFLSLVASAETRDQLEPLPNIEFNLLPGNSLIGLLKVDPGAFDSKTTPKGGAGGSPAASSKRIQQARITLAYEEALGFTTETTVVPTTREKQQAHVATKQAAKYDELLRKKNERIRLYKESTSLFKDLAALKRDIDELKTEARGILDQLLLDQFQALGIKFEQATWDAAKKKEGKPVKRELKIGDIAALHPFHWAYEFDEIIINRGGFDAIITNPPWENFKPDDKEFFMALDEKVSKHKMRPEEFVAHKADLLATDPEVRLQYLAYLSRFPYVNLWFRNATQFENQTAVVRGKKAATDLNLYKLFLEQTQHLLGSGGYCGIIIPSGIYTDLGAARLREMLLTKARLNSLFGFSNEKYLFDGLHHAFKFCILTYRDGGHTEKFSAAFRINPREAVRANDLDGLFHSPEMQVCITTEDIRKFSPDSLSIFEFKSDLDLTLARKFCGHPRISERIAGAWQLSLQREFHMTDDGGLYHPIAEPGMAPLVEGKGFHQFNYPFSQPRYWVDPEVARSSLADTRVRIITRLANAAKLEVAINPAEIRLDSECCRLAFRDITASTNERTMIATILPPRVFCPHTVTLETVFHDVVTPHGVTLNQVGFDNRERLLVSALFNSFAVDYQLRQQVTAHLSFYFIDNLPIPRLTAAHPDFLPLAERAARLVGTSPEFDDLLREVFGKTATHKTHGVTDPQDRLTLRAEIDALVARLYDLTVPEFQHILTTFPLVDESVKSQTLNTYRELVKLGKFV